MKGSCLMIRRSVKFGYSHQLPYSGSLVYTKEAIEQPIRQVVAATRTFSTFGNVTSSSGAWAGPFGYAGKFGYQSPSIPGTSTPDEGLQLLGHRYYDPSTGRFLTRDPIFDGRNWYSYGGGEGNPLTGADPTGLAWHDPVQVIVSASFEGTVIAFGDFPWMPGDGWRDTVVRPGFATHPDMDVDMILIINPDGTMRFVFLPGFGIPGDGKTDRTCYYVDHNGEVSTSCGLRPIGAGSGWGDWWDKRWSAWIEEAYNTGFPKGYEPRQHPSEPCVWRRR